MYALLLISLFPRHAVCESENFSLILMSHVLGGLHAGLGHGVAGVLDDEAGHGLRHGLEQVELLHLLGLGRGGLRPLPLLLRHLVPPQPVLVVRGEGVDHNRDGQREDEDAGERAEPAEELPQERARVEVVPHGGDGHEAPPEALHEGPRVLAGLLLGEVDERGEGQDGHGHEEHEEAELLVGLSQGQKEGLQAGEMPDKLEDAEDAHDPDEADDLAGLADDGEVLEVVEEDGEVEGDDGAEVDEVHGLLEEAPLAGRAHEADEVLQGEEDDDEGVDVVEDDDDRGVLALALVHRLELLHRRDDERQRREDHHAQREERHDLEKEDKEK